jgi:putative phage-type endonuclease
MIKYAHFLLLNLKQQEVNNYHQIKEDYCMISASEFGALFGVSPYMSKKALWKKLKGIKPKAKQSTFATEHGKKHEGTARELFWDVYKHHYSQRLFSPLVETGTGFLQSDPRFCASPDGLLAWTPIGWTRGAEYKLTKEGLEIKCPFSRELPSKLDWNHCHYLLQCVLGMEVFDVDKWHLFFYKDKQYAWFAIHRNKGFFESGLKPELDKMLAMEKEPPNMKKGEKQAVAEAIMNQYIIETLQVSFV